MLRVSMTRCGDPCTSKLCGGRTARPCSTRSRGGYRRRGPALFQQVKRFGMGGMLRATLEIEFMHQTLTRYVSPAATKTLSELYNKISMAYARRPGYENLQGHLDNVRKTLAESRRATSIEVMCFRQPKEKSASKATNGKPKSKTDSPPPPHSAGQIDQRLVSPAGHERPPHSVACWPGLKQHSLTVALQTCMG
ncbi:hypothetical protein OG21DRAFT_1190888 [Imleria badia]|nr:hypothetical protein OG21DRAFT_1190888 [Imleria badia]